MTLGPKAKTVGNGGYIHGHCAKIGNYSRINFKTQKLHKPHTVKCTVVHRLRPVVLLQSQELQMT